MWIKRKKYEALLKENERLKLIEKAYDLLIGNDCFKNFCSEIDKEVRKERNNSDKMILNLLIKKGVSRTELCEKIGISFKTLRNVLNGEKVKDLTKEKIKKYLYNEQGSLKNEFSDYIKYN